MRPPVAPYLTVSPAMAAIAFYTTVFGAKQQALMPALDGLRIMHCELLINGGSVMLADAFPEFGNTRVPVPGEPMTVSVSLEFETSEEVDLVFKRAIGLGSKGETNPTNSFWGTRLATFRDPFGHRWILNAPLG
ncbi:MAG: VOC family protein [Pseudomonadota bacterium]|jgi:PhnB protein|uniref:VOC family protein n=1 Tax=uncultured Methylovirgula sp. TaxID=1285960 RepID=UPI0026398987|nr:VOC family protein [uncultured Methylovirgula sp.]